MILQPLVGTYNCPRQAALCLSRNFDVGVSMRSMGNSCRVSGLELRLVGGKLAKVSHDKPPAEVIVATYRKLRLAVFWESFAKRQESLDNGIQWRTFADLNDFPIASTHLADSR